MKKIEIRNKEIQKICSAKNKEIRNKEIQKEIRPCMLEFFKKLIICAARLSDTLE